MAEANSSSSTLIMLLVLLLLINNGRSHEECKEISCGTYQPLIRFPFQLIKGSQDRCAYPEFCLSCTENNKTMISLPTTSGSVQFFVSEIDYMYQNISISDPDNCLPEMLLRLNTSSFQFYQFDTKLATTIAFFNCSSVRKRHLRNYEQSFKESQDMITCPIYATNSNDSVLALDLLSCTKMSQLQFHAPILVSDLTLNRLSLSWPKPNCTVCEVKGDKCRWKWNNNSAKDDIDCFYCNNKRKTIQIPKYVIFATTGETIILFYFFTLLF